MKSKIFFIFIAVIVFCGNGFSQSPSVDELVSQGITNYNAGNLKTSYELFKQAMKINPNHPEASRWFWKMKKEHDVKNLYDKGPIVNVNNKDNVRAEEQVAKNIQNKKVKEFDKSVAKPETKIIVIESSKSALLDKKMSRIDEKIEKLSNELKLSRATPERGENIIAAISSLSPLIVGIIIVFVLGVVFLILFILNYRARLKRMPAPPVYIENADAIAKKVMERLGLEESEERKLLALDTAKKLIDENPSKSKQIVNLLTRLSLDKNETISQKSRLLINMLKPQDDSEVSSDYTKIDYLTEPIETYTEGYLILLQSKYQWDHSRKVRLLAREIGLRIGLTPIQNKELEIASLLENVGFIRIPDSILNKKSQLSKEEMANIRMHPEFSAEIAQAMKLPVSIVEGVRCHHERYNGNGYPSRLHGSSIPLYARIIGICDSFAAITSRKTYKNAISVEDAIEIMKKESYLFDPEILNVFFQIIELIHFSELTSSEAVVVQA